MPLAFSDYAITVVAAEVSEPAFWDAPDAVSFGGSEMFVIQPPLHRAEVISEKLYDLNVSQRIRLECPFAEEKGSIFLDFLVRQISYLRRVRYGREDARDIVGVQIFKAGDDIVSAYLILPCFLSAVLTR